MAMSLGHDDSNIFTNVNRLAFFTSKYERGVPSLAGMYEGGIAERKLD